MLKVGLDYLGIKFDNLYINKPNFSNEELIISFCHKFELPYKSLVDNNQSELFEATVGKLLDGVKQSEYFKDLEHELTQAKETIKQLEKYKTYYEMDQTRNVTVNPIAQFNLAQQNRCKCK